MSVAPNAVAVHGAAPVTAVAVQPAAPAANLLGTWTGSFDTGTFSAKIKLVITKQTSKGVVSGTLFVKGYGIKGSARLTTGPGGSFSFTFSKSGASGSLWGNVLDGVAWGNATLSYKGFHGKGTFYIWHS
jgi:hypothetical protein